MPCGPSDRDPCTRAASPHGAGQADPGLLAQKTHDAGPPVALAPSPGPAQRKNGACRENHQPERLACSCRTRDLRALGSGRPGATCPSSLFLRNTLIAPQGAYAQKTRPYPAPCRSRRYPRGQHRCRRQPAATPIRGTGGRESEAARPGSEM